MEVISHVKQNKIWQIIPIGNLGRVGWVLPYVRGIPIL